MIEFLVIAWVAWQFTNLLVQDGIHAIKGTTPPRHVERMERLRRGEDVPTRYGFSGYLKDLLDDALRADVERRRRKREEEAAVGGTQVPDPSTAAVPTGDGRPEEPVAATVPDPAAPVADTEPESEGPASSVVHTDDHSYCEADDCRTETDRHTDDGPSCPLRCGGRIVGHRVSARDNQTKDLLCSNCGWLVKKPPVAPTPDDLATSKPEEDAAAAEAEAARQENRRQFETQGRCVYPIAGREHGMCGRRVSVDPQHGGHEGNTHCGYHTAQLAHQSGNAKEPERNAAVIPFPTQPGAAAGTSDEGATMNTDTTNPSGVTEVTGMASAVAYAKGVSAAHAAHGDGESYVGSLANFEVGASDIDKVRAAQEASRNAAALWQTAADALQSHNMGVREAYASSPDAGNKQFATSE